MQGTKIGFLVGGVLLALAGGSVQAETLQPDPAWQQGKLDNGFTWQLLTTPQRPGDRIELRLVVNAGSLAESAQQSGFAHLISRLALTPGDNLPVAQLPSLLIPEANGAKPLPPVFVSYDYTSYNLSLPNNRPELLKDALNWLAETAGGIKIDDGSIANALRIPDQVVSVPADPQDPTWRYRLKGSSLLAHDPAQNVKARPTAEMMSQFYKAWYTPDAMTLYVVGHVESRQINELISKAFVSLEGKRATPAPMPTLAPLPAEPIGFMLDKAKRDTLSLVWDMPWHPIRESQALTRYWHSDVAREALFWHVQQALEKSGLKETSVRVNCDVYYTRAQCGIHLDSPNSENAEAAVAFLAKELVTLRDKGLTQQAFDALIARKSDELSKLFATYARTSTDVLMQQRLRSQRNGVVDIAPEQYQKLRQAYLSELTLPLLNQELHQQLSQETTLMLKQQKGEQEVNTKALYEVYSKIMTPPVALEAASTAPSEAAAQTKPVQ